MNEADVVSFSIWVRRAVWMTLLMFACGGGSWWAAPLAITLLFINAEREAVAWRMSRKGGGA